MTARTTQRDRILARLVAARGGWVSSAELSLISLQYGARVFEIKNKLGLKIENRTKTVNGTKHGEFRLVTGPTAEPDRMAKAREWIAGARAEPAEPKATLFDMERQHFDDN